MSTSEIMKIVVPEKYTIEYFKNKVRKEQNVFVTKYCEEESNGDVIKCLYEYQNNYLLVNVKKQYYVKNMIDLLAYVLLSVSFLEGTLPRKQ